MRAIDEQVVEWTADRGRRAAAAGGLVKPGIPIPEQERRGR